MSRTTRTERSASWKTSAGAVLSFTRCCSTSLSLNRYCSSRSKSPRVAPWAAVRMIAPPPPRSSCLASWRRRWRSASSSRRETPTPSPVGRVDHVAPGDGQLHREPRALGLERVLDDLHDDLLPGPEQVGDARAGLLAAAALHLLDARQHDLVDVQEAVLVEADVDERRLEPGQDVVDLPLVDVADDGAPAAALEVDLGDAVAGGQAALAAAGGTYARRCGSPAASSMATRVSPRSTVTSTCFLKPIPHWKTVARPLAAAISRACAWIDCSRPMARNVTSNDAPP